MYKKSSSLIYMAILIIFLLLFYTPSRMADPLFLIFICLTGIEVILISNFYKSLLFTTINVITAALIMIIYMSLNPDTLYAQSLVTLDYFIFIAICFALWFLSYSEYTLKESLIKYKKEVAYYKQLQKYKGILSPEAFANEEAFILNAAQRRKETCYYLHIELNTDLDTPALSSLMATLGIALVNTFREHYDIIKKDSATNYLCLLQNVTSENILLAEERLKNNLSDYFLDVEHLITFKHYEASLT